MFVNNIYISDCFHGNTSINEFDTPSIFRILFSKSSVGSEGKVWIGENLSIIPNATIGRGSIIGANSVVNKGFPPYLIVAGIPVKNLKINV